MTFLFAQTGDSLVDISDTREGPDPCFVHIRIQQRNARKSVTTISGLPQTLEFTKLLRDLKKRFCCNGKVTDTATDNGKAIQLQGDQRQRTVQFLVEEKIVQREQIKVHGA